MNLLGLELSDAGIILSEFNTNRLLAVDGQMTESPGFAFVDKKKLIVGKEAEKYAHIKPDHFTNHFWDQLNTESIKIRGAGEKNHAEIACAHLEAIWKNIPDKGEVIIAVPDFFDRLQLGIILGMAKELSISTRGIIPISLAAAQPGHPGILLHLDIHLHRITVTFLEQGDMLVRKDTFVSSGKGLDSLFGEWMKAIADVFVRTTRFDPLHNAASEQELYSKIPTLIDSLRNSHSTAIEMSTGTDMHQATVSRDLLVNKSIELFQEIRQLITSCLDKYNISAHPVTVLVSGRASRLPGLLDMLAGVKDIQSITLADGAAAQGALAIAGQFTTVADSGSGVSFLTQRPWQDSAAHPVDSSQETSSKETCPTHVLCRNIAYPITETPLIISQKKGAHKVSIVPAEPEENGLFEKHCSIQFRNKHAVLENPDNLLIHVDETMVTGATILRLGQNITLGNSKEKLQLIACLSSDATKKN